MSGEAPEPRKRTWSRRCMVDGCPVYGRWFSSDKPPPPTEHPSSHYSQVHAAPEDVAWPSMAAQAVRRPV